MRKKILLAGVAVLMLATSLSATPPYQQNITMTSQWFAGTLFLGDGAILYSSSRINPYFANLGATGLLKDSARYPQVLAWMHWYINHLNWPDKWGYYGTTYDYNIVSGKEVSSGDADSTDSYAGTFLSLAWAYWKTGDASGQSYIRSIKYQLDVIGSVITKTQQSDGLTWAKPDYLIKYLEDNSEAYRGLRDLASLMQALGDSTKASYYTNAANKMQAGIMSMWISSSGRWAVYKDWYNHFIPPNMGVWYPDATSQLYPTVYGVVSPSDSHSKWTYYLFNQAWPGWPNLSYNSQDPFPWTIVGAAASLMGDSGRINTYFGNLENKYVNKHFPWPWYCMEAGFFMRSNSQMMGHGF